jgi:hypothetical protein
MPDALAAPPAASAMWVAMGNTPPVPVLQSEPMSALWQALLFAPALGALRVEMSSAVLRLWQRWVAEEHARRRRERMANSAPQLVFRSRDIIHHFCIDPMCTVMVCATGKGLEEVDLRMLASEPATRSEPPPAASKTSCQ